jgi:hypothetical protein
MSDDQQPFFAPNRRPPPARGPRATEHLWAIRRNGRQYDGELLDHGTWGVEFQVLDEREWYYERRSPTRELALAEADDRKAEYLRGGGVVIE